MTAPIRPEVYSLVDFTEPENMTLREAVEWYKRLVRAGLGVPTDLEARYMNERWAALCQAIAKREKIPSGWVSYMLSELAQTEVNLLETVQTEAQAAVAYGQSDR